MRPPAESNLDSPHAVFAQRQHFCQKTRESTRKTSKNLENPSQIDLKSTKIAPREPPRATLGEKSRSERPLEATSGDLGGASGPVGATRGAPGSPRGRSGDPGGGPWVARESQKSPRGAPKRPKSAQNRRKIVEKATSVDFFPSFSLFLPRSLFGELFRSIFLRFGVCPNLGDVSFAKAKR